MAQPSRCGLQILLTTARQNLSCARNRHGTSGPFLYGEFDAPKPRKRMTLRLVLALLLPQTALRQPDRDNRLIQLKSACATIVEYGFQGRRNQYFADPYAAPKW